MNTINPVNLNAARVAELSNNNTSLDERVKSSQPISMNEMAANPAIKWMMQQFMEKMYSSVDECPFAIEHKQEW